MVQVLTVGIAVLDTVFRVAALPREGHKFYASARAEVVGGIAANAAVAIARLGGTARLATRLGDDPAGERIVAELAAAGVDTSLVEWLNGMQSSVSAILVDPAGERLLVNHADMALFQGAAPSFDDVAADAVMADTCWPEGAVAALRHARRTGVPGVLDYDRLAARLGAEMLTAASHVVFGRQGLEGLSGTADIATGLAIARQRTDAWLACTSGSDGVFWLEGDTLRRLPCFEVQAVDTLGAGDVFHAALALALGEGQAVARALPFASAAAALKCQRFGGGSVSPSRTELERFLRDHEADTVILAQ